jgi:hypothetical protein
MVDVQSKIIFTVTFNKQKPFSLRNKLTCANPYIYVFFSWEFFFLILDRYAYICTMKSVVIILCSNSKYRLFRTTYIFLTGLLYVLVKAKLSRYIPYKPRGDVDRHSSTHNRSGARRNTVVISSPRPVWTPQRVPATILQEAVWASGPVGMRLENLALTGFRTPDFPPRGHSLYWLCYSCHHIIVIWYVLHIPT